MTNPVSANPTTEFPPISMPFVNSDGTINDIWYRCVQTLWKRTGGPVGASSSDVQTTATSALNLATQAGLSAALATTDAANAQATANTANTVAIAAATAADAARDVAEGVSSGALISSNNLSDVTSIPNSRFNLGLSTYPIPFNFDTCPSGLTRYVPIVRSMIVPASLNGTVTYCGVLATANSSFTLAYIRGGVITTFGTIVLEHGSQANVLSSTGLVTLNVGDILTMTTPNPADSTMANVGITILVTLN